MEDEGEKIMVILSETSKKRLVGVDPRLVKVIQRACELHPQGLDFMVVEGVRTLERQKELIKIGATQTLRSRHLVGKAVDLAPMVNGKLNWDLKNYSAIAESVYRASREQGVTLRWGGCWKEMDASWKGAQSEIEAYVRRCKAVGKRAFIDAPHFELPERIYG